MLAYSLRVWGLIWACLTLLGCQTLGETEAGDGRDDLDRTLEVALDIEVQITLSDAQELTARPQALIDVRVEKGSGLKLSDEALDGVSIVFALRGTKIGLHRLIVEYEDEDGKRRSETLVVSVSEIESSGVDVECQSFTADNVVPVGAEFTVDGFAFDADGNRLHIGGLNVVKDSDGFELIDEERRLWRAPQTAGRYEWRLLGKKKKQVEWVVYDPAASSPKLQVATRAPWERPKVSLGITPQFEGTPLNVCIAPSNVHVDIEAVAGDCHPAVGAVAFDGGLSLAVPTFKSSFWATGEGNCTLRATTEGGISAETTLNVDIEPVAFSDSDYVAVEEGPVKVDLRPRGSLLSDRLLFECPNDSPIFPAGPGCPSDFFTDEGCIERTHWKIDYVKADPALDYVGVGTGLVAELEIYLRIEHASVFDDDVYMLPNFMQFEPQTNELEFTDLECTRNVHVFQVMPQEAGEHPIALSAEDTTHGHTHNVHGFDVARTSLELIVLPTKQETDPEGTDPESDSLHDILMPEELDEVVAPVVAASPVAVEQTFRASVRHLFVGEQRGYKVAYFDVDDRPLHGVGLVNVESSDADAGVRVARFPDKSGFGIYAGSTPSLVEVSSPHAPEAHRIHVEEAPGIAAIEGLELAHVTIGSPYCVRLFPLAEDGLLIEGHAPTPPIVKGAAGLFYVSEQGDQTCFTAHSAGEAALEWTWGNASKALSWFAQ